MKYPLFLVSAAVVGTIFVPSAALAISPSVVISELQTGDSSSLSNEFVEMYNSTTADVAVDGWTMEYKSATGVSWSKKATLSGTINSHGFYLLAPSTYLPTADQNFTAGLSG